MNYVTRIFLMLSVFTATLPAQNLLDISKVGPGTEQIDLGLYTSLIYVSANSGMDDKGSGTMEKPYHTIAFAMRKVKNPSENNRTALIIGEGIYSGVTIEMKEYVDLLGGFNGISWERDIYKYSSVLDGEGLRRVVVGANNSKLDGFTVRNGLSRFHGGGILCDDTSPEISNCFIVNNYALEPENFNHNRIHQNGHHGGGIASLYNAVPVIRNNVFYRNRTSIGNGGAVAFYGWLRIEGAPETKVVDNAVVGGLQPVVENNVFIQNISGVNDIHRTRSSNGGAVSCSHESRPVIRNNVVAANRAKGRGDAGGIYSEYFSYPVIAGNWIVGNISDDDGGGIYVMKLGEAVIVDNFIAGNWTVGRGVGGIRLSKEGRAKISDNIIVRNLTGGGIDCVDSYMEADNNIIMNNKGKSSVRYYNHYTYFRPSELKDNIIRENENEVLIETFGGPDVIISGNNIDQEFEEGDNFNREVKVEGGKTISVYSIHFDDDIYQSMVELDTDENLSGLNGRVARLNDYWSVVQKIEGNIVYVWGDASGVDADIIEILSDYKIE